MSCQVGYGKNVLPRPTYPKHRCEIEKTTFQLCYDDLRLNYNMLQSCKINSCTEKVMIKEQHVSIYLPISKLMMSMTALTASAPIDNNTADELISVYKPHLRQDLGFN